MLFFSLTACGVDTSSSKSTSSSTGTTTTTGAGTDAGTGTTTNVSGGTVTVVDKSTGSGFSKKDAKFDANACILNTTFKVIEDSSLGANATADAKNGLTILSQYPFSSDIPSTQVALFYPPLKVGLLNKKVYIYEDNYRLGFDKAWYSNTLGNVYIRTPKDTNGAYSCYRYELNSVSGNAITKTKVYR